MGIRLSDRVENIVEKGELARYEQFLIPTLISKATCC